MCTFSITILNAQNNEKIYAYGIDYSYAKVYAADESVEQFAKAFENINMLIVTEPEKYDFSRIMGKRVEVVIEPMLKVITTADYANLKSLNSTYEEPKYSEIVKNYKLPQTEGVGVVLVAKLLNKPMSKATYELITFDISTREKRSVWQSRRLRIEKLLGRFSIQYYKIHKTILITVKKIVEGSCQIILMRTFLLNNSF